MSRDNVYLDEKSHDILISRDFRRTSSNLEFTLYNNIIITIIKYNGYMASITEVSSPTQVMFEAIKSDPNSDTISQKHGPIIM